MEKESKTLELWCLHVGSDTTYFTVEIDGNKRRNDLAAVIKKKYPTDFAHIEAIQMHLCTAKVDFNAWLPLKDPLVKQLMKLPIFDVDELAEVSGLVTEEVEQYDTLGEIFPRTSNKELHVLIATPPSSASKRAGQDLVSPPPKRLAIDMQSCAHALKLMDNEENPNVIILGNPGIGKTYFGYLLVWYLVNQGMTVVYENRSSLDVCVLITPNGVARGSLDDFHPYLRVPTTFYIVDGVTPRSVLAKTILLTSPKREIWYPFRKQQRVSMVYMPVWTWKETMVCHKLLYPSIPDDILEDCFDHWGGIPRYVLQYAEDPEEQRKLDDAIERVDLVYLESAVRSFCDQSILHRVMHLQVNRKFNAVRYMFASEYVEKRVVAKFLEESKDKLIHFLKTSRDVPAAPLYSIRGALFEGYAHRILAQGGAFSVRLLNSEADASCAAEEQSGEDGDDGGGDNDSDADDDKSEYDGTEDDYDDDSKQEDFLGQYTNARDGDEEKGQTRVFPAAETVVFKKNSDIFALESVYCRPNKKDYPVVDAFECPDVLFRITVDKRRPCKHKGIYTF